MDYSRVGFVDKGGESENLTVILYEWEKTIQDDVSSLVSLKQSPLPYEIILGPKLLLAMGCVKLGEKIAFSCLLWVNKTQINYPISRNP